MINDYSVIVRYKNKNLQDVGETVYPLHLYAEILSGKLKDCLTNVEDSFTEFLGEDANLRTNKSFMAIRKQLLDVANAISRLPTDMYCKGVPISNISTADFIANAVNNM